MKTRVVVIDDDSLTRLLVTKALQSAGMHTIEAGSGEEGLRIFVEQGADAILLDVVMPDGMDGFDTCMELRKLPEGQHTPVLMMTGLEDLSSINKAFEVGATDFITKPINIPLLSHRVGFMLKASDTTQRLLQSERRLHRLAYYDNLTELPNRQFFREHLQHMIALAKRQKIKLAVLFLDLDGFKRINDTLGHHMGDLLLQATSERLRQSLRSSDMFFRANDQEGDTLARLGGDEFTVLLTAIERPEDAALVAERIKSNLAQPHLLDGHELFTTSSIGVAIYPDDGDSAEDLLKNADLAMYYAKRSGGNKYQYFSSSMTQSAFRRLKLENNLRKAIDRNELVVHYQPLLDLKKERFCGAEALLRWKSQDLGEISPLEFIPLAEESGLIVSIGEWVLRQACSQATLWIQQGFTFKRMAVNVSGVQLLQKNFLQLVSSILAETGLEPAILEMELTESALITDEENVLDILHSLKELGVELAIDDFGVGYSSLSRLKNFPIDRLKIDKTFIQEIDETLENSAIASAVIAMADSMGMKVTAEGVETEKQLAFLKSRQCNEVQGFFLSHSVPANEIEGFLARATVKS